MAFQMNDTARRIMESLGGGGSLNSFFNAQPKQPATPERPAYAISLEKMLDEASRLAGEENARYAREYTRLGNASDAYAKGFEADDERATNLALGSQFDQIGRSAADESRQLRTQLGGRGVDPSSGLATFLSDRIGLKQAALRYGAMRGAAQDSYQRRNAFRTAQYAQQAAQAQFGNQSPSLLRLDALTNQAEFDLADLVSQRQADAAKYSAKQARKASDSSSISSVIKSFLGGIF